MAQSPAQQAAARCADDVRPEDETYDACRERVLEAIVAAGFAATDRAAGRDRWDMNAPARDIGQRRDRTSVDGSRCRREETVSADGQTRGWRTICGDPDSEATRALRGVLDRD